MELTYRREPDHSYMIPEMEIPAEDGYILQMLIDNRIPGFLEAGICRMNGAQKVRYDITARQPISVLYARRGMSGEEIRILLRTLADACESVRSYLMNPADILFLPECIYMDPEDRLPMLCYLPGYRLSGQKPYEVLAEFILRHLNHEDKAAVDLGYGFYERCCRENFSFTQCVREMLPEHAQGGGESQVRNDISKGMENSAPDNMTTGIPDSAAYGRSGSVPEHASGEADFGTFADDLILDDEILLEGKILLEEEKTTGKARRWKKKEKKREKTAKKEAKAVKDRQEKQEKKKTHGNRIKASHSDDEKKHRQILAACILVSAAVYAAIVWFFALDLTQIGGLAFLFISVGWLIYGTIQGSRDESRNHWAQESTSGVDEDAFIAQLMHEVYAEEPSQSSAVNSDDSSPGYGHTRILTMGVDMPEITLVSENKAYPNLKPLLPLSLIGKQAEEVDLVLPRHPSVSRIHAKLECGADGIYISDANSTNGTFVNGQQIRQRTTLQGGDQVSFAGISYRVVMGL